MLRHPQSGVVRRRRRCDARGMKAHALAFLDRFRQADREDALLDAMAEDSAGLMAALAEAPEALLTAAEAAGLAQGPPVDLHPDSFASAACDAQGRLVVADARFADWLGGPDPLAMVVQRLIGRKPGEGRPHVSAIADDCSGRPVAVAAAGPAIALRWPLAGSVRAAVEAGKAAYVVIAFRPVAGAWEQAARAYGLGPQEARLASALALTGELRGAAAQTGIAYETARKLVQSSMRKVGVVRQTELVRRVLAAAAGDLRGPESLVPLMAELFGLTLRQARLATAVAHGAQREDAAAALGISVHAAKTDLKTVFLACGVSSAVDLARVAAEVEALAGLAQACNVEMTPLGAGVVAEPLRFVARRRAPGRIALTDHGPAGGRPLLMVHAAVGGRHLPRRLVAALTAAGWRPISIERPGFGLTDMIGGDPFANAAEDAVDVVDALALGQVHLLARTAATAGISMAARLGSRVAGGLLVAPEPPAALDTRWSGMSGHGKALFFGQSAFATAFARILSQRTSSAMIERMQRKSVAGSAIDEAALDDPDTLADHLRASRQAALGMAGFLAEMQAHGRGARPPALADGRSWVVLAGALDPMYRFEDAAGFWAAVLPGALQRLLPDGGRWLHLTHEAAIVTALAALLPPDFQGRA